MTQEEYGHAFATVELRTEGRQVIQFHGHAGQREGGEGEEELFAVHAAHPWIVIGAERSLYGCLVGTG